MAELIKARERIVVESWGLRVGGLFLPPFVLRSGDAICLHIDPSPIPWFEEVLPLLSGEKSHVGLRFFGSVAYLQRPMPRRRWWGGFQDRSARTWLTAQGGLTPGEADMILSKLTIPTETYIGWIGWNERTQLALEAMLLHPPDVLVFDTAGNDPVCIGQVLARLRSRPSTMSLVYLKVRDKADDPCCPGAVCLHLRSRAVPMAVAK